MLKTIKRWVDSLFPGTWHLPDGRTFVCDDYDIRYYCDRSKDFFSRGVPLPVCLEHQPLVGLSHHDRLAEQTRNTLGHCHDARIGSDGQLQYLVDGTEEDLLVMAKNKYVSPEIRVGVVDTLTGHRFEGPSICRLAVTPRLVQVSRKPHFQLSQSAAPLNLAKVRAKVSLSRAVAVDAGGRARRRAEEDAAARRRAQEALGDELAAMATCCPDQALSLSQAAVVHDQRRRAQEALGDELAAMAGFATK